MTNIEAHHEINAMLTSAIKKREQAQTLRDREILDKPIEALRHAARVLRMNADKTDVEQPKLF